MRTPVSACSLRYTGFLLLTILRIGCIVQVFYQQRLPDDVHHSLMSMLLALLYLLDADDIERRSTCSGVM